MISPTEGQLGTTITITGTHWIANDRVSISVTPPRIVRPSEGFRPIIRVRVGRDGTFVTTLTIPLDERLADLSTVWVLASGSRRTQAYAEFRLLPAPGPGAGAGSGSENAPPTTP